MDDLERLADEIADLEAEISVLDGRRDELTSLLSRPAKPKPKAALVTVIGVVTLLGVSIAVLIAAFGGGGDETMYGEVTGASGSAPVAVGDPCTAFYAEIDSEDYDASFGVVCGGRTIYGGGSYGAIECDYAGHWPDRCHDPDFTPDGGDPRLTFERARRTIVIDDVDPQWAIEIALTTPLVGP